MHILDKTINITSEIEIPPFDYQPKLFYKCDEVNDTMNPG